MTFRLQRKKQFYYLKDYTKNRCLYCSKLFDEDDKRHDSVSYSNAVCTPCFNVIQNAPKNLSID